MLTVSEYLPTSTAAGCHGGRNSACHLGPVAGGTAAGRQAGQGVSGQPAGDLAAPPHPEAGQPGDGPGRRHAQVVPAQSRRIRVTARILRTILEPNPGRIQKSGGTATEQGEIEIMTSTVDQTSVAPVCKSVTVKAGVERAFEVFTEGIDTWWPRTHHIVKSPMKKAIIEGRAGGRCYSEQVDGTDCDWGQVLVWEPPRRFVMAWKITHQWGYEPDVKKASEVEVRFTPQEDGSTRVDLEHRYFQRHGEGAEAMRTAVDSPGGWNDLLQLYVAQVAKG